VGVPGLLEAGVGRARCSGDGDARRERMSLRPGDRKGDSPRTALARLLWGRWLPVSACEPPTSMERARLREGWELLE